MGEMREVPVRGYVRTMLYGLVMLCLVSAASAQTSSMNIKRVQVNWPDVEVFCEVDCGSGPEIGLTPLVTRMTDNGWDVSSFTHDCPDAAAPCRLSSALVLDASGSMSGAANAELKNAAHAFIDLLDGVVDEASVVFFNNTVVVQQQMTALKPLLHGAVDALPASGGTAVWDDIHVGVLEVITSGTNNCKAVIVVTDGQDNASTHTPAEIISLAARNHVHVFAVGLGSNFDRTALEQIARQTGGRFADARACRTACLSRSPMRQDMSSLTVLICPVSVRVYISSAWSSPVCSER